MKDAENLAYALDPAAFAKAATSLDFDDWQQELLLLATQSDESRILCLAGRQTGKSKLVSVVAAYWGIFDNEASPLTVVASGSLSQSQELGRSCFAAIRAIDPDGVKSENMTRLELKNGHRIVCLPCSETVRGLANARIICDEAQLLDASFFAALEPMGAVTKKPKFIVLGSATTRATHFYKLHQSGLFRVFERRSDQCPRISAQFLSDLLKSLGPSLYNAEACNVWLDSDSQMVSDELLAAAIDNDYTPLELL